MLVSYLNHLEEGVRLLVTDQSVEKQLELLFVVHELILLVELLQPHNFLDEQSIIFCSIHNYRLQQIASKKDKLKYLA